MSKVLEYASGQRVNTYNSKRLSETLLLGRRLMISHVALCLVGKSFIGVGAANGTVGLVEYLLGLFEERSHLLDQLLFVAVLGLLSLEVLDPLLGDGYSYTHPFTKGWSDEPGEPS